MRIEVNILITASINITVLGSPRLVDLPDGAKAVELNGVDQALDIPRGDRACPWNPEACALGLSAGFRLKVTRVEEAMYIFSNGGDEPNSYGMAMYYSSGRYLLTVR